MAKKIKKNAARKATPKAKRVRAMTRTEQRFNSHANWLQQLERRVNILEKSNSLLKEVDAIKEEKGKWVPKVGDWIMPSNAFIEVCPSVQTTHPDPMQVISADGDHFKTDNSASMGWHIRNIRPATQAEIEAHLESSAYGEREGLEEGMACECTGSQVDELRAIMVASDLFDPCYEGNEKRGAWLVWMPGHTGAPLQNYGKDEPPQANEIPFPVFKKLLIKTIEKLRSAREEEEAKKPIDFGMHAKHKREGWDDLRVSVPWPDSNGRYELVRKLPDGEIRLFDLVRSEFTIINP